MPLLPELVLRCDDLACLAAALRRGSRGQPQPSAMTDEDLEAYKYTFGQPGRSAPAILESRTARGTTSR